MITQPHPSWVTPHSNGTTARVNEVNTYTIRQALGYGDHCSQNKEPHLNRTDLWHIKPKSRSRCHGWTNREARQTCNLSSSTENPFLQSLLHEHLMSAIWIQGLISLSCLLCTNPHCASFSMWGANYRFWPSESGSWIKFAISSCVFSCHSATSHSVSYSQCFLWFSLPLFMA